MSEAAGSANGPDLRRGIAVAKLDDGVMLRGHVGETPALLVRRGAEVLAIGATCTHYGGPLVEGLVVGDTVRCPWHHACFSLRTGAALRPPALNDLPCWRVEQRDGMAFVREELQKPAPPSRPSPGLPASVVIIGGGAAGLAAAEAMRSEGYPGSVILMCADPSPPCDRPNLSKDYLAGTAEADWIPLRPPEFYPKHRIDLQLRTPVTAIEPGAHAVLLADGNRVTYGALLLATGAEPIRLDIPGASLPHVHVLRTRGLEVHVIAPEARPMERVMGAAIGDMVRAIHESHGVHFHLGTTLTAIAPDAVTLSTGERLPTDLVVVGIGVRPAVALATQAGLAVDRGVVVDEFLQTSEADIYAAGDIARWPDKLTGQHIRVEHWVVAERQGRVAASNMLGRRQRFNAVPFFWSQHYDTTIAYVGHAEQWDRLEIEGDPAARDCAVSFWRDGRKLAVATVGRDRDSLRAEVAFEQEAGA